MHEAKATGLSPRTKSLLDAMLNSGDTQQIAIAEALDMIASNGEGQEEDSFLLTCAQELVAAAVFAETQLMRHVVSATQEEDPTAPDALADLLSLVDVTVAVDDVEDWPLSLRQEVEAWAVATHLRASDNEIAVPRCPAAVPPDDATLRLHATEDPRTGHLWDVRTVDGRVDYMRIPACADHEMACRFAYLIYKNQLVGQEWSVEYVQ